MQILFIKTPTQFELHKINTDIDTMVYKLMIKYISLANEYILNLCFNYDLFSICESRELYIT